METTADFIPGLANYTVRRLHPADAGAMQTFFERCNDFNLLVDGEDVSPTAGQDIFLDAPPSFPPEAKFMFGVYDRTGEFVGLLEGMWGYPQAGTCWIGLLLFTPQMRGQGLGRRLMTGFEAYARSQNFQAIMLGVVEENTRAYTFWQNQGFELIRETEPKAFGKKMQKVYVFRKTFP